MSRPDPNLQRLQVIAEALGDLRDQVVFVGGSTAGLLLSDPLAEGVRPTLDVDAIVQAEGLAHFHRIEAQVEQRGFLRDIHSDVICRWRHGATDLVFDLMPVDPAILGFTNRWYGEAVRTAQSLPLANGIEIHVVAPAAFVATKLEAFLNRGRGDYLSSHDLEDVLNVVDGRPELHDDIAAAVPDLRRFVADTFAGLLANPDFNSRLPGLITDADRAGLIADRLQRIASTQ